MGDHGLEEKQGKLIADAAQEANISHLLWSSLPYSDKISKGKYSKVVHFDGKARVEEYIRDKKLPATFVEAGFYMTNLMYFMPPSVNKDGILEFVSPMIPESPIAMIDIPADFGSVVLGVLKAGPAETTNLNVRVAGEYISFQKVVQTFEQVTGRKVVYKQLEREAYKQLLVPNMGEVVAEEFVQMLQYFDEFGYFGGADISATKKFNPNMTSFEHWLKASGWTGPQ